jgi:tryptophan halogenase
VTQAQEDAFNRLTGKEYARIRDFLILHYNSTTRDDSPFWNYCRNMPVPDSLTEKVELFRQNGQIFREDDELFTETSWAAVMMGQGIKMGGHNAMADAVREPDTRREIDEMEKSIQFVVQHMPSHGEYLNRYCPAPA